MYRILGEKLKRNIQLKYIFENMITVNKLGSKTETVFNLYVILIISLYLTAVGRKAETPSCRRECV